MAVIAMVDVQGQTKEGYDGMSSVLFERVKHAPGFVMHSAYQVDGAWRVLEVWQTEGGRGPVLCQAGGAAPAARGAPEAHAVRDLQPGHRVMGRAAAFAKCWRSNAANSAAGSGLLNW